MINNIFVTLGDQKSVPSLPTPTMSAYPKPTCVPNVNTKLSCHFPNDKMHMSIYIIICKNII